MNHHTHYHSHYHSTTVGSYTIQPRTTLTGAVPSLTTGLPSLTTALPGPGVPYTTVIHPGPGNTLPPQRPTHTATIVNTRPPSRPGYQYLPPQGQASDKVATYVRPESGGRAHRELISPRDATGGSSAAQLRLSEVRANLVDVGPVSGGLSGPGVQQQGPQTELQEAASTDLLVLREPAAGQQEEGLSEKLRQLGLLRFLSLVERAGLEKLLESRGEYRTSPHGAASARPGYESELIHELIRTEWSPA